MKQFWVWSFVLILLTSNVVFSQVKKVRKVMRPTNAQTITDKEMDNATKKAVVEAWIKGIQDYFVFPEKTEAIATFLKDKLATEKYQSAQTAMVFARELTAELRAFANERHLGIQYQPEAFKTLSENMPDRTEGRRMRVGGSAGLGFGPDTTPEERAAFFESPMMRRFTSNVFNMRKIEVLDGNVGYFKINQMPPLEVAKEALDAAMNFLSHCDALIIDVRGNTGGVGGFNPYWMSYFFEEEGKVLFQRATIDTTYSFHTQAVDGKKMVNQPLFILTSGATGSAAENISFTLKHHLRAKTVGEPTVGAAHSATQIPLVEGFTAIIAIGRLQHPMNDIDFEGIGVQPDLAVQHEQALEVAHRAALETLLEGKTESTKAYQLEEWKRALEGLNSSLEEKDAALKLEEEKLQMYVGEYGERTVSLEFGKLRYLRKGGIKLELKALKTDVFQMVLPEGVRTPQPLPDIRFEKDEAGTVKGFTFLEKDGREEYIAKNEE